jgi:hypothetical protein
MICTSSGHQTSHVGCCVISSYVHDVVTWKPGGRRRGEASGKGPTGAVPSFPSGRGGGGGGAQVEGIGNGGGGRAGAGVEVGGANGQCGCQKFGAAFETENFSKGFSRFITHTARLSLGGQSFLGYTVLFQKIVFHVGFLSHFSMLVLWYVDLGDVKAATLVHSPRNS